MTGYWKHISLWLFLGAGLMALPVHGDDKPSAKEPSAEELVLQLGAGEFKVRERAEQLLAEMGKKALPVLKKNADSADPEISLRVKRLLDKTGCVELKALFAGKKRFKGFGEEGDKSRTWPCVMDVKEFNEETGKFKGQIEWLNLDSLVAIEGTLSAEQLVFTETQYIRQGNSILNCVYTFDLKAENNKTGNKIQGIWKDPSNNRSGNVELAPDEK